MPFQQQQPCTTTSTHVKGKPANLIVILLVHSLLLELIMLLFLNCGDLQGHSTYYLKSVAKQNISVLSVRFTMWPGMHMVHVNMQVHTYTQSMTSKKQH